MHIFQSENLKEREYLVDVGVNGRVHQLRPNVQDANRIEVKQIS
jgi:hypothetical protein